MTTAPVYPTAADLSADDYVAIGLATCFIKQEGEVHQVLVAEPIPSAALEALIKGIPTSYQLVCGTTLGALIDGQTVKLSADFPAETQICDDFAERVTAAARTYKRRKIAQSLVPSGTTKTDFNFSTDRKRVLNSERIIKAEDNVKQHAYTHQVL